MARKSDVDYSVYLVTDSTAAILGDWDVCEVVEAALRGGATCVQYRDKTSDTGALVRTARRLHAITRRYGVPLLVNDRVDVALAVGCEGVHIGQDDIGALVPPFFSLCSSIKIQFFQFCFMFWNLLFASECGFACSVDG